MFSNIKIKVALVISVALLFLSACQDTENNNAQLENVVSSKSGKVAIVLTDAPSDEFSEVNLTITQIALLRSEDEDEDDHDDEDEEHESDDEHENDEVNDENNQVIIFEGEETINLLAVENYSHLFALSTDVPVGTYKKIRLSLKKDQGIELVKRDENGEVTEIHYPKAGANGKLDLKAKDAFEVTEDQTLFIQLDIDAKKSIHIVKKGNGKYQFRPVVFIDVITPEFAGKLVRHTGFIRQLDADNSRFSLCTNPQTEDQSTFSELCLLVHASEASIFNEDGDEKVFNDLAEDQFVTVIGHVQSYNNTNENLIEFGQMSAQVIHVGDEEKFSVFDGITESAPDDQENTFEIRLNDQSISTVALSDATKLFTRDGLAVSVDHIEPGVGVEVHGVVDSENAQHILASLIVIDMDDGVDQEKMTGTVQEVFASTNSLNISTDEGDRLVMLSQDVTVISINTASPNSFSEIVELNDIAQNQRVDVYGVENGIGEFIANLLLVVVE